MDVAKERAVLNITADLWNAFLELKVMHNDDQEDFRFHLHALQNIIYSRIGYHVLNAKENHESRNP